MGGDLGRVANPENEMQTTVALPGEEKEEGFTFFTRAYDANVVASIGGRSGPRGKRSAWKCSFLRVVRSRSGFLYQYLIQTFFDRF